MSKRKRHRFAWRSTLTGQEGRGGWLRVDRDIMEKEAKKLDSLFPEIRHWVEAEELNRGGK